MSIGKELLYLMEDDVRKIITSEAAIELAEKGIIGDSKGEVAGNKFYMDIDDIGFVKPFSGYLKGEQQYFIKTFTLYPNNIENNLPLTASLVILNDTKTGLPVCIMEATWVTGLKTGASTAVAVKYLAKRDSKILTIFGAGTQGRHHIECLSKVISFEEIRVYDVNPNTAKDCISQMKKRLGLNLILADSIKGALEDSDVIITVTSGNAVLVKKEWIKKGAIVVKLGSFQEIDTDLPLQVDKVIVDNWYYVKDRIPELVNLQNLGKFSKENIFAEWKEIVSQKKSGRENEEEIILFIALGVWGEYAAILPFIYQEAVKKQIGQIIKSSQI